MQNTDVVEKGCMHDQSLLEVRQLTVSCKRLITWS